MAGHSKRNNMVGNASFDNIQDMQKESRYAALSDTSLAKVRSLTIVGYDDEVYNQCARVEDWELNSHLIDVRNMTATEIRRRIFEKFNLLVNDTEGCFEKLQNEYIIVSTLDVDNMDASIIRPLENTELLDICRAALGPSKCILRLIKIAAIDEYKRSMERNLSQKGSRHQNPFHSLQKTLRQRLLSNNNNNISQHQTSGSSGPNSGKTNSAIKQFLVSNSKKLLRQVSTQPHYNQNLSVSTNIEQTQSNRYGYELFKPRYPAKDVPCMGESSLESREEWTDSSKESYEVINGSNSQSSDHDSSCYYDIGGSKNSSYSRYDQVVNLSHNALLKNGTNLPKKLPELMNPNNRPPSYMICKNMELFFPDFKFEKVVSDVFLNNSNVVNNDDIVDSSPELESKHEGIKRRYSIPNLRHPTYAAPKIDTIARSDRVEVFPDNQENSVHSRKSVVDSGTYDNTNLAELVKFTLIKCQKKRPCDLKRTSFGRRASQQLCTAAPFINRSPPARKSSTYQSEGQVNCVVSQKKDANLYTPLSTNYSHSEYEDTKCISPSVPYYTPKLNFADQIPVSPDQHFSTSLSTNEIGNAILPVYDNEFESIKFWDVNTPRNCEYTSLEESPDYGESERSLDDIASHTQSLDKASSPILESDSNICHSTKEEYTKNTQTIYVNLNEKPEGCDCCHMVEKRSSLYGALKPVSSHNEKLCDIDKCKSFSSGAMSHLGIGSVGVQTRLREQCEPCSSSELSGILPKLSSPELDDTIDIHFPPESQIAIPTSTNDKHSELSGTGCNIEPKYPVKEYVAVEEDHTVKTDVDLEQGLGDNKEVSCNLRMSSLCSDNAIPERIEWLRGPLIGKGSFGKVFYAVNMCTYEIMAVKQVDAGGKNRNFTKRLIRLLRSEISLMKDINHENVVSYTGFEVRNKTINIFLEYVSGGTISTALSTMGPFEQPLIRSITCQVLCGLEYLHERNIIHRDIKGTNILLNENGVAKISDFGVSKKCAFSSPYKTCSRMSFQGSVRWMAPEVIRSKGGYSAKVDIWSLGCVVIEMITGTRPWDGFDQMQTMWRLGKHMHPEFPKNIGKLARSFLTAAFATDPKKRPTASKMLKHPYADVDPAQLNFSAYRLRMINKNKGRLREREYT